jgi:hypothetical protein
MVATKEVFLWYFHVYMYYNPNWFIFSIFLHSTLVPFLWCFQLVLEFYIHSCIENISTTFILVSFFYPTFLVCDLPLLWPAFYSIAVFVLGLYSNLFPYIWEYSLPLPPIKMLPLLREQRQLNWLSENGSEIYSAGGEDMGKECRRVNIV